MSNTNHSFGAYAGKPANTTSWYEGVVESEADYDTPVVGGKIIQVYTAAGARMEMSLTVTEYEPDSAPVMQMQGMVTGTYRWDFIPEARRDAYVNFSNALRIYINEGDAEQRLHIHRVDHPTVWQEMKRQHALLPRLAPLFAQAPEALDW